MSAILVNLERQLKAYRVVYSKSPFEKKQLAVELLGSCSMWRAYARMKCNTLWARRKKPLDTAGRQCNEAQGFPEIS